jgi:hypothetical protein
VLPALGVAVIAAFNAYYWLPIPGESPPAHHPERRARSLEAVRSRASRVREAAVWTVRNRNAVRVRCYDDRAEALEAVGL